MLSAVGSYARHIRRLSDEDLRSLAADAGVVIGKKWDRTRIFAELLFEYGYGDPCHERLDTLSTEELGNLARVKMALRVRPEASRRLLLVRIRAYLASAEECNMALHEVPTYELRDLAVRRGLPLPKKSIHHWKRTELLPRLVSSMSSPENVFIEELSMKSDQDLHILARQEGMCPHQSWGRSRYIAELAALYGTVPRRFCFSLPSEADALAIDETASRYVMCLQNLVDSGAYQKKEDMGLRDACYKMAIENDLNCDALLRLVTLWKWTHRRTAMDVNNKPPEPLKSVRDITQGDFAEADVALTVASARGVERESTAFALLSGHPWVGPSMSPERNDLYEDDVELSDDEADLDELSTPLLSLECDRAGDKRDGQGIAQEERARFRTGVMSELKNLPGGQAAPSSFVLDLFVELGSIATMLRRLPESVDLAESTTILNMPWRGESIDHQNSPLLVETEHLSPLRGPARLSLGVGLRSQSRFESMLWRGRTPRLFLQEINGTNEQLKDLAQHVLEPRGLLHLSMFIRRFLISVYGTVEGIAEDWDELLDVSEVLGDELRTAIFDGAVVYQGRLLRNKLKDSGNVDDNVVNSLIRSLKTARRVLNASWTDIVTSLNGDRDKAHRVSLQMHGAGQGSGNPQSVTTLHEEVLPWLCAANMGQAYWWAANLNLKFAGRTEAAQSASLKELVTMAESNECIKITSAIAVYDILHRADRCKSADARRRYVTTSRAAQLLVARTKPGDGILVAAEVMEQFDGDVLRALAAKDKTLLHCIERAGGAVTVGDLRKALALCGDDMR